MKIVTILGTRPEIIRLSIIIRKLDRYCDHVLVHTGQNFDENLSDIFFDELSLRAPDHYLGVREKTFGSQIGHILIKVEEVLLKERPNRVLILGDTNSGLASIIAKRMGIPVYHMEAGNRCYDFRVPEEVNRHVIDHSTTIHLPYTHRSKENLLREGISPEDIYVIGNPILEVIEDLSDRIDSSTILKKLGVKPDSYFLVTMHRAENVDLEDRLRNLVDSLNRIHDTYELPIICSLHPRTRSKLEGYGLLEVAGKVTYLEPMGLIDFVALEKNARCVITDSGTVQEECCIFSIPNITIRDVTERPETIESGSNMIASVSPDQILSSIEVVLKESRDWVPPAEYMERNVSGKVVKILLGHSEKI